MDDQGFIVKHGQNLTRVHLKCAHQNALLYTVPAETNWVCSSKNRHVHSLAGFLEDLIDLKDSRVKEIMQKRGLYFRKLPLDKQCDIQEN